MRYRWLLLETAVLALAVVSVAAVAAVVAHRVIRPRRARPTRILEVDGDTVVLSGTTLTRFPGMLGLLYDDELRLAVLQPDGRAHCANKSVKRTLQTRPDPAPRPGLGRAVGNVFANPDEIDQPVSEVLLDTALGPAPAWAFGPDTGSTWLVHIHGSLSGREGALRSVAASSESGMPSLVPSYRGDHESPRAPRNAFMLGQTEWRDIEPALDYAVSHGARQIVLLGWSSGASMALRLATNSKHRAVIAGIVAISPVLDWAHTIRLAARTARLPKVAASLSIRALEHRLFSRLVGAPKPIQFAELAWAASPVPTLLIHSAGDQTASYADSVAFRNRNPARVAMPAIPPVPHALEWNADPVEFARVLVDWLGQIAAPSGATKVAP